MVTDPFPRATATKFRIATGPEPDTPVPPAARETFSVASPASLRTSLIELTVPPLRESRSPGAMSVSRSTAGSHLTRKGVIANASAAPFSSTFTVKGVFGPTETLPGRNTTRVPAAGGTGGGAALGAAFGVAPGTGGKAIGVWGAIAGAGFAAPPAGPAEPDPSSSRGAYIR